MNKLLLILFLFYTSFSFCQSSSKEMLEKNEQLLKQMDSAILQQQKKKDSIAIARDIEHNNKNLDYFLADYKERQQKEKRRIWWRLGLGIAFAGIGVFAILRRRKQ